MKAKGEKADSEKLPVSFRRVARAVGLAGLGLLAGCRQAAPVENGVANANTANVSQATNAPAPVAPVNANAPAPLTVNTPAQIVVAPPSSANAPATPGQTIPAREPEQYRATLTLKVANKTALTADVARNGTDRRLDFKLSDGTKLIYLYQTDRLFLIAPEQKVYAEQEGPTGAFTLPSTLDPERLVQQLQADARYALAGEEKFANRAAIKYAYTGGAQSFVYTDKETGLPLHVEMAQTKPGTSELILTTIELSGVSTDIPLKHFNEPRDMQQVEPEQMRTLFGRVLQASVSASAGRKQ